MKIMTVLDLCEDDDSDEGGECDDSHRLRRNCGDNQPRSHCLQPSPSQSLQQWTSSGKASSQTQSRSCIRFRAQECYAAMRIKTRNLKRDWTYLVLSASGFSFAKF